MMSDPAVTKGMAVVKELFKVRSDPADILARGCTPTSIPEKSKAHSARCSLSRAIYFFTTPADRGSHHTGSLQSVPFCPLRQPGQIG